MCYSFVKGCEVNSGALIQAIGAAGGEPRLTETCESVALRPLTLELYWTRLGSLAGAEVGVDTNGDGLSDWDEVYLYRTDPTISPHSTARHGKTMRSCRARSDCIALDHMALDDAAWYKENSSGNIHPSEQKDPNAWGIHDVLGNVWE